jgi:hypothetical protein
MTLADDDWVKNASKIEPEKLHALGVITFMWNACEYKLFELFCVIFGITPQMAWLLVHDLGDVSISNRISAFLQNAFPEPNGVRREIEVIENALEAYDVCRQNRNQFTHFALEHDLQAQQVYLRRQQKGPVLTRIPFPTELSDFRRVATELFGLNNHLNSIINYLRTSGQNPEQPLPGIVPLPELLAKPLPQAAPKQQPRREPSVLKLTEQEWLAKYRKEGRSPDGDGTPQP